MTKRGQIYLFRLKGDRFIYSDLFIRKTSQKINLSPLTVPINNLAESIA